MALAAVLEFGDNQLQRYSKQYLVTNCRLLFERPYNNFRPEGAARCERMELELVAPGKTDLHFFEWYISQGIYNGRLVINFAGADATEESVQVIIFEDAICYALSENYDVGTSRRRMIKLGISAEKVSVDGMDYKQV